MKRSRLRNIYLRYSSPVAKQADNKQTNLCCSLIKKSKRDYYSKLDPSLITAARKVWKTTKPLFSEKIFSGENLNLIESENIISSSKEVAEIFTDYFSNAVKNLNIKLYEKEEDEITNILDPIKNAIVKYKDHQSIKILRAEVMRKIHFHSVIPIWKK